MIQPIRSALISSGFIESRQGGRTENQDYAGAATTPCGTVIIVCDGMGGMQGGSIASVLAVNTILNYMKAAEPQEDKAELLTSAIKKANEVICEESLVHPELRGMGTTVTALLINEQGATAAHVGDSRIYQLRKGRKVFRSFDHSMVFEMVKKKIITEEQARKSAQSNILLRALGIDESVEVECHTLPYKNGDRFVLCSDGFWGIIPEKELISYLTSGKDLAGTLEKVCDTIEDIARRTGGEYDNMTAAIIETGQNSLMREVKSTKVKIIITLVVMLLISLCMIFLF